MKPILIIKTGNTIKSLPPTAGDFEDWIIQGMELKGDDVRTVSVFTGESLPPPGAISAAVVTGSPAMVTDREDWSEYAAHYLRELLEADLPVLGICYGHQLLAHALGGEVGWHPEGREIGTWDITLRGGAKQDLLFRNLPERFPAHTTHSQSVLRLPPGSEVLAASAHDPFHGVRFGPRAWGVQFHPEFDAPVMRAYIHERCADLAQEGLDPDALLGAVRDTESAATLLRRFHELVD